MKLVLLIKFQILNLTEKVKDMIVQKIKMKKNQFLKNSMINNVSNHKYTIRKIQMMIKNRKF